MRNNDLRSRIDALVSWYEKFKPDAGQRIPVSVSPQQLLKALPGQSADAAGEPPRTEFSYRGRTLVAVGPSQPASR